MSAAPAVAALDWGTTRLRAWLLDGSGKVLAERRGDDGLITAREKGFAKVLEGHLDAMGAPEALPVIICGMAGSRQGWIEAPYVTVPAPIGAILRGAARIEGLSRDIRIVPGLAQRLTEAPDVMRGMVRLARALVAAIGGWDRRHLAHGGLLSLAALGVNAGKRGRFVRKSRALSCARKSRRRRSRRRAPSGADPWHWPG